MEVVEDHFPIISDGFIAALSCIFSVPKSLLDTPQLPQLLYYFCSFFSLKTLDSTTYGNFYQGTNHTIKKSAILKNRKREEEKKKSHHCSEVIARHCGFSSPHFLVLKTRTRSKRNPSSHFLLRFCQWRAELCTVQWGCLILILTWNLFSAFASFSCFDSCPVTLIFFLKFYFILI